MAFPSHGESGVHARVVIPHDEPEDMVDVEQSDAWTSAYENGGFVRKSSEFRSDFPEGMDLGATSGRFHLYISHACPWAHRTILTRLLLGLEAHISVDVVDWRMEDDGSWVFNPEEPGATTDRIHGSRSLEDLYLRTDPTWQEDGRIGTVPVLWDREADTIVNNESREIIRMLGALAASGLGNGRDLAPEHLRSAIESMIDANYESVNNGVYKAGFARTQGAYEAAVTRLFDRLGALDHHLQGRDWLVGPGRGVLTEADVCLFTTLVRFDLVYVVHFKCNLRRVADHPNLMAFLHRMLEIEGVRATCDWTHIKSHYFWSHKHMNPHRIIPLGPIEGVHLL